MRDLIAALDQECATHNCGHERRAHDEWGCDSSILTVLDTEGNCQCKQFTPQKES